MTYLIGLPVIVTAQIKFKDVTKKAGLIKPLLGMMGHGAAWGDVNGDGYPDLFYGSFAHYGGMDFNVRGNTEGSAPNKLFINQKNGTFKEILNTPIRVHSWNSGAAFADFDNDGDLDLVVSHQHHADRPYGKHGNYLFANDGDGIFTDVTKTSNLYFDAPWLGRNTFVFDYDGDGLLDIFMQEDWVLEWEPGGDSRLMKNMGDLTFKDVTAEAGFPTGKDTGFYGIGGFVGDINGDSWPDVFFAHSCRMFINNKNGTFHEKKYNMVDKKMMLPASKNPNWTCGADLGDLDNDGDMDIVMGDHYEYDSEFHSLYVFQNKGNDASGDPILQDITVKTKIKPIDGRAPHLQIQDINNDGLQDIMVSKCNAFVYENKGVVNGIPEFESPIDSGIVGGIGYWASGPLGDYDRDGRLDFIGPEWEPAFASPLLRNVSKKANNYLAIKPELENSLNRNAIGAKVEIYKEGMLDNENERLGTRIISVSNGYSSGTEAIAYFGLPDNKYVDVRVTMPCDGKTYVSRSVKRNQYFIFKK